MPKIGLFAAAQRYVLGTYEDSVLHSAFSVEMALLLKLDRELEAKEKQEIRKQNGLSFGRVIRLAKDRHILSEDYMDQVWVLYNLRNMFAHPGNWVTFVKRQSLEPVTEMLLSTVPEAPALIEGIRDIAERKLEILRSRVQKLKRLVDHRLGRIPNLEWAAHQGTLSFQQERSKSYYARVVKDLLKRRTFKNFIKHSDNFVGYAQKRYPYSQDIAFEALQLAFEILEHLDILQ